jgi:glycosyltransferase involved in cell wall biosynthesis
MKIGIDARMYGPKQGGLGRYIEQLILNLEDLNETDEFVIFLRQNNWDEYNPKNPNFKKILADIPWYGWQEQIKFPKIIHEQNLDLIHFPHWNIPLFYNKPFITTIHDLILLHFPTPRASTLGSLKYWLRNLLFRAVLHHAVKKARHILTPSEFTRQDIVKTLKINPNKITTSLLAPMPKSTSSSSIRSLADFHITKPFILYVGVAYPHKNLENLILAWQIFQKKYDKNYHLVLVGIKNYFYDRLSKENDCTNIVFTDFISNNNLIALYQQASLYVFPSLYEGFGLPPLEAMQYDLPVISSDQACLPEILQDACLYFNPLNPKEMAETIHRGLTDQTWRQETVKKSQKLVHNYSWKTTANTTLRVYRDML